MAIKQYRLILVQVEKDEDAYGHVTHRPVGTARYYKGTLPYIQRLFNKLVAEGAVDGSMDVNIIPAYKRLPWETPEETDE